MIDPFSGEIIDVNPAACEFYQYSHEEMTKLRVWDINMLGETEVKRLINKAENAGKTEFSRENGRKQCLNFRQPLMQSLTASSS